MTEIEILKQRRAKLAQEINEIDQLLILHDDFQSRVKRFLQAKEPNIVPNTGITHEISTAGSQLPSKTTGSHTETRRSVRAEVAEFEEHTRAILQVIPRPTDRAALLELLTMRGVVVGGKDPKNTLGTRLTRMHDVENIRGEGYWLTSRMSELRQTSQGSVVSFDEEVSESLQDATDIHTDSDALRSLL